MKLDTPPRLHPRESVVPMINVVFLLLIFFLMTARIAPPDPFDLTLPESSAEAPAEGRHVLYVSADGEMAMGDSRGEAVFGAMSDLPEGEALMIRADRGVEAGWIAALLPRLAAQGVRRVKLVSGCGDDADISRRLAFSRTGADRPSRGLVPGFGNRGRRGRRGRR